MLICPLITYSRRKIFSLGSRLFHFREGSYRLEREHVFDDIFTSPAGPSSLLNIMINAVSQFPEPIEEEVIVKPKEEATTLEEETVVHAVTTIQAAFRGMKVGVKLLQYLYYFHPSFFKFVLASFSDSFQFTCKLFLFYPLKQYVTF